MSIQNWEIKRKRPIQKEIVKMKRQISFIDNEMDDIGRRILHRLHNLHHLVLSSFPTLQPSELPPNSPIIIDLTSEDTENENVPVPEIITPVITPLVTQQQEQPVPTQLTFEDDNDESPVIHIEIHHTILVEDEINDDETDFEDEDSTNENIENNQSDSDNTLDSEDTWSLEEEETEEDLQFVIEDI